MTGSTRPAAILLLLLASAGCETSPHPDAGPRPDYSQRAAPRAGQDEITLLAPIEGTLAISGEGKRGCLGLSVARGRESFFVTIVWPSNTEVAWASGRWFVENTETGQSILVGMPLRGGGGFNGSFDRQSLRRYNRFLTRDLSPECAALGSFSLNRDFGPG